MTAKRICRKLPNNGGWMMYRTTRRNPSKRIPITRYFEAPCADGHTHVERKWPTEKIMTNGNQYRCICSVCMCAVMPQLRGRPAPANNARIRVYTCTDRKKKISAILQLLLKLFTVFLADWMSSFDGSTPNELAWSSRATAPAMRRFIVASWLKNEQIIPIVRMSAKYERASTLCITKSDTLPRGIEYTSNTNLVAPTWMSIRVIITASRIEVMHITPSSFARCCVSVCRIVEYVFFANPTSQKVWTTAWRTDSSSFLAICLRKSKVREDDWVPSLLTTALEKAQTVTRGSRPRVKKYRKIVEHIKNHFSERMQECWLAEW